MQTLTAVLWTAWAYSKTAALTIGLFTLGVVILAIIWIALDQRQIRQIRRMRDKKKIQIRRVE
jgi:hypothetical protein